jgi:hypothetical protein
MRQPLPAVIVFLSKMARAIEDGKSHRMRTSKRPMNQGEKAVLKRFLPVPMLSLTRVPPEEGISQMYWENNREEAEVTDDTRRRRTGD